jgi:hypothetical protein
VCPCLCERELFRKTRTTFPRWLPCLARLTVGGVASEAAALCCSVRWPHVRITPTRPQADEYAASALSAVIEDGVVHQPSMPPRLSELRFGSRTPLPPPPVTLPSALQVCGPCEQQCGPCVVHTRASCQLPSDFSTLSWFLFAHPCVSLDRCTPIGPQVCVCVYNPLPRCRVCLQPLVLLSCVPLAVAGRPPPSCGRSLHCLNECSEEEEEAQGQEVVGSSRDVPVCLTPPPPEVAPQLSRTLPFQLARVLG